MSWKDRLVKSRASYVKPRRSQILSYISSIERLHNDKTAHYTRLQCFIEFETSSLDVRLWL